MDRNFILDLVEFGAKVADVCEEGVISYFGLDRNIEEDIEFAKAIGYETARRVAADIIDGKVSIDITATDEESVKAIEDLIMKHLNDVVKEMDSRG